MTTTFELTLPAYMASALINGDVTGIEDEDMPWLGKAFALGQDGSFVGCSEESWFSWACDLYGHKGCNVATYTVLVVLP